MVGVAAGVLAVTWQPRLMRWPLWRATVTPLASIIGSGFLVAAPILGVTAGGLAVVAMAGLCAVGWLFGSAIRFNIRFAEPLLDAGAPGWLGGLEEASNLALLLAYFVSVAYYLDLFAAFALRSVGIEAVADTRILATAAIALIGTVGFTRGLRWLENLELPAVGLKLALIAGVLAALAVAGGTAIAGGTLALPSGAPMDTTAGVRTLLGLVILVQGFETSRYLGADYDRPTRVRTMRIAQILATLVYIAFVGLATPYLGVAVLGPESATEVIDLLAPLGAALAPVIIVAALASQFSAGVADTSGAGGLASETARKRISPRVGYALTAGAAILITWSTDIYGIIVWASKAFVAYYGLQSAIAFALALRGEHRAPHRAVAYAAAIVIAVAAVVFGTEAGAG